MCGGASRLGENAQADATAGDGGADATADDGAADESSVSNGES